MGTRKRNSASKTWAKYRRAHKIATILHDTYGSPHHSNKEDPLDELIFILLSQMTTGPSFNRVFERLKTTYPSWDMLTNISVAKLRLVIKDAGLSWQKAPRIKKIIRKLKTDFGSVTLLPLSMMTDVEAEHYLLTLPGVGLKTAKCVLMYSLSRTVLPADTHVRRVAQRLGLIDDNMPTAKIHDALESVVAPSDRYSFHVNGLAHGRAVCTALRPRCSECPIRSLCSYPGKGLLNQPNN